MREVAWMDRHGYKHVSLIRDTDPDDMAEQGIPLAPPNVDRINWEEVKRELHNALIDHRMFGWQDVQRAQNALTGILVAVLKRKLVLLYRQEFQEVKEHAKHGSD